MEVLTPSKAPEQDLCCSIGRLASMEARAQRLTDTIFFLGGTPRAARVGRRLLLRGGVLNAPDYCWYQSLPGKYSSVALLFNRVLVTGTTTPLPLYDISCITSPTSPSPHQVGLTIPHAACLRDTARALLWAGTFCLHTTSTRRTQSTKIRYDKCNHYFCVRHLQQIFSSFSIPRSVGGGA